MLVQKKIVVHAKPSWGGTSVFYSLHITCISKTKQPWLYVQKTYSIMQKFELAIPFSGMATPFKFIMENHGFYNRAEMRLFHMHFLAEIYLHITTQ